MERSFCLNNLIVMGKFVYNPIQLVWHMVDLKDNVPQAVPRQESPKQGINRATTVVLSVAIRRVCQKHFRARRTKFNSRKLMWSLLSDTDHRPLAVKFLKGAPNPMFNESIKICRTCCRG